VVGGLAVSTVFTMFLVPVLLSVVFALRGDRATVATPEAAIAESEPVSA